MRKHWYWKYLTIEEVNQLETDEQRKALNAITEKQLKSDRRYEDQHKKLSPAFDPIDVSSGLSLDYVMLAELRQYGLSNSDYILCEAIVEGYNQDELGKELGITQQAMALRISWLRKRLEAQGVDLVALRRGRDTKLAKYVEPDKDD